MLPNKKLSENTRGSAPKLMFSLYPKPVVYTSGRNKPIPVLLQASYFNPATNYLELLFASAVTSATIQPLRDCVNNSVTCTTPMQTVENVCQFGSHNALHCIKTEMLALTGQAFVKDSLQTFLGDTPTAKFTAFSVSAAIGATICLNVETGPTKQNLRANFPLFTAYLLRQSAINMSVLGKKENSHAKELGISLAATLLFSAANLKIAGIENNNYNLTFFRWRKENNLFTPKSTQRNLLLNILFWSGMYLEIYKGTYRLAKEEILPGLRREL